MSFVPLGRHIAVLNSFHQRALSSIINEFIKNLHLLNLPLLYPFALILLEYH